MSVSLSRGWIAALPFVALVLAQASAVAGRDTQADPETLPPPVELTAQQDHQRMMELLHITALRQGPSGNPQAPNAANTDEAKANPYPNLPDPLLLKNGKKVTSAKSWWSQRRPEIVEDFDREIYRSEEHTSELQS